MTKDLVRCGKISIPFWPSKLRSLFTVVHHHTHSMLSMDIRLASEVLMSVHVLR